MKKLFYNFSLKYYYDLCGALLTSKSVKKHNNKVASSVTCGARFGYKHRTVVFFVVLCNKVLRRYL